MKKTLAFICVSAGSVLFGMLSSIVGNLGGGATLTEFGRMTLIPFTVFATCLVGMSWIYFFYIEPREIQANTIPLYKKGKKHA